MRNLKKFLALVLAMMMVMGLTMTANAAASDINGEVNPQYQTAVDVLFKLKILHGGDNGYLSDKPIMRSEFAMMLYRLHSGFTNDADSRVWATYAVQAYTDVAENHWAAGAIGYCREYGLLTGVGNNRFNTDGYVDGDQVLAGLLKTLGYNANGDLSGDGWRARTEQYAGNGGTNANLIGKLAAADKNLGASATRETVAQLLFYVLQADHVVPAVSGGFQKDNSAEPLGKKFGLEVLTDAAAAADDAGKQDAFGRPAASKVVKIGTDVVDTVPSETKVATYTGKYAADDAEKDLAARNVRTVNANVKAFVNGYPVIGVSWGGLTVGNANIIGNSGANFLNIMTNANNNVVEVYVNGSNEITTVVAYNVFVNKLAAARDATAGTISLSDSWMTSWPVSGGAAVAYKVDGDFAKDDIVLYTHGWDGTRIVAGDAWKATAITEGVLTRITETSGSPRTYTINDETYVISDAITDSADGIDFTLTEEDYGKEWTYYIDPDNNAIVYVDRDGADPAPSTPGSDYAIVIGASVTAQVEKDAFTGQDAGEMEVEAILRLLTHSGSVEELPIKVVKSTAGTGENAGKEMIGTVVKNASNAAGAGSYYLYVDNGTGAKAPADYIKVWDKTTGASTTANGIQKWEAGLSGQLNKACTYKLDTDGNVELTLVKGQDATVPTAAGTYAFGLEASQLIQNGDVSVVMETGATDTTAVINNSTVFVVKSKDGKSYTTTGRSTMQDTRIDADATSGDLEGDTALVIVEVTGTEAPFTYVVKYVFAKDAKFKETTGGGADTSEDVVFVTGTRKSEYVDGKTVWTYEVYDLEGNKDELVYEPTQAHASLTRGFYALKTDGTLSDTAKTTGVYAVHEATVGDIVGTSTITVNGNGAGTYSIEGARTVCLGGATRIEKTATVWAVLGKSGETVTKDVRILFVTPKAS